MCVQLSHAVEHGALRADDPRLLELGELLSSHAHLQRLTIADTRLTIADSTGVGASDLCIAEAAYHALAAEGSRSMGAASAPSAQPLAHTWQVSMRAPSRL